jgi:hypothetical protein
MFRAVEKMVDYFCEEREKILISFLAKAYLLLIHEVTHYLSTNIKKFFVLLSGGAASRQILGADSVIHR